MVLLGFALEGLGVAGGVERLVEAVLHFSSLRFLLRKKDLPFEIVCCDGVVGALFSFSGGVIFQ